ncbi:Kinesin light chain 3 [Rhizophlyctis rosea]|nr:Kinesin light chain 3 [Rhizophlyctis rosea]
MNGKLSTLDIPGNEDTQPELHTSPDSLVHDRSELEVDTTFITSTIFGETNAIIAGIAALEKGMKVIPSVAETSPYISNTTLLGTSDPGETATASIIKLTDGTPAVSPLENPVTDPLPLLGVRLSFLPKFINQCDGRGALRGLTTAQVCEKFIHPQTTSQKSFCHRLSTESPSDIGTANWFISHCWQYTFLDVLDSIISFFQKHGTSGVVLWFDLFSVPQHGRSQIAVEWLKTTFMDAISSIQNVLMIITPWDKPITLTRAWCIFELYATVATKSNFHVSLPPAEIFDLRSALTLNISRIHGLAASINTEASEASNADDLIAIQEAIRETVGFKALDDLIIGELYNWIIAAVETKMEEDRQKGLNSRRREEHHATWLGRLARLYEDRGLFDKAERSYHICLNIFERIRGEFDVYTCDILLSLGWMYDKHRKFVEGITLLQHRWTKWEWFLGDNNYTAELSIYLGNSYSGLGHFELVEPLYYRALEWSSRALGIDDVLTISIAENLAGIYVKLGGYDKAVSLLGHCLDARRRLFGTHHFATRRTAFNLGHAHHINGAYNMAALYYEVCIEEASTSGLTASDLDTLYAISELGRLYIEWKQFAKAREQLIRGLLLCEETFGEDHSLSLSFTDNLALAFHGCGNRETALLLYLDSLGRRVRLYGKDHPETTETASNIEALYYIPADEDLATPQSVYLDCLGVMRTLFGESHPPALMIETNIALMWYRQGYVDRAKEMILNCRKQFAGLDRDEHPDAMLSIAYCSNSYDLMCYWRPQDYEPAGSFPDHTSRRSMFPYWRTAAFGPKYISPPPHPIHIADPAAHTNPSVNPEFTNPHIQMDQQMRTFHVTNLFPAVPYLNHVPAFSAPASRLASAGTIDAAPRWASAVAANTRPVYAPWHLAGIRAVTELVRHYPYSDRPLGTTTMQFVNGAPAGWYAPLPLSAPSASSMVQPAYNVPSDFLGPPPPPSAQPSGGLAVWNALGYWDVVPFDGAKDANRNVMPGSHPFHIGEFSNGLRGEEFGRAFKPLDGFDIDIPGRQTVSPGEGLVLYRSNRSSHTDFHLDDELWMAEGDYIELVGDLDDVQVGALAET